MTSTSESLEKGLSEWQKSVGRQSTLIEMQQGVRLTKLINFWSGGPTIPIFLQFISKKIRNIEIGGFKTNYEVNDKFLSNEG